MNHPLSLTALRLAALALMLTLNGCAGTTGNGGSPAQSSGTPVNPFTNPGAADSPTAASTGAQPRSY